jgi:hypothetical protein
MLASSNPPLSDSIHGENPIAQVIVPVFSFLIVIIFFYLVNGKMKKS